MTLAAAAGSDSSPYENASLHTLPTAPAPAIMAALAVLEKVDVEAEVDATLIALATLSIWASCVTVMPQITGD